MKARILVIEDEPAINNLLCMNLEVTGYQTVSYLDGNDASEGIAWDHEFQCALVDIMLPGKDGYTLLPELNHYGIPDHFSHRQSRHHKQSKRP
ncbi:MAG: response regulator [Ruminococcus sp.]